MASISLPRPSRRDTQANVVRLQTYWLHIKVQPKDGSGTTAWQAMLKRYQHKGYQNIKEGGLSGSSSTKQPIETLYNCRLLERDKRAWPNQLDSTTKHNTFQIHPLNQVWGSNRGKLTQLSILVTSYCESKSNLLVKLITIIRCKLSMILLASIFTKSSITADTAFRKDLTLQGCTMVNPYTFDQSTATKAGLLNPTLPISTFKSLGATHLSLSASRVRPNLRCGPICCAT